jgi:hypothetical protein
MVAEQAVAQALDRAALALRARLDGEIAFGVEPDRAIVEIGRAHMQEDIIDDHQLGVHHHVDVFCAVAHVRREDGHAIAHAGSS